jgi:hypothetical protein
MTLPVTGRVKTPRRLTCKDQLEFVTLKAMYGRRDYELTVIRKLALIEISSTVETISAARF